MTLFQAFGQFAGQAAVTPAAAPGMVLLTPTSTANSGGSASIGANGQVTFTGVNELSLNGVFTADFDNYVVSGWGSATSSDQAIRVRMRVGGVNNTTGSSYTFQTLTAASTTVSGSRVTGTEGWGPNLDDEQRSGFFWSFYAPFLAQPTAWRSVAVTGNSGAQISEYAGTHNQSTSYDGFTIYPGAGSITGKLQVYGVRS
jgi:hypothetical protein